MDELYQHIGQLYLELVRSKSLIGNLNTNLATVVKQFEELNVKHQELEQRAKDGGVELNITEKTGKDLLDVGDNNTPVPPAMAMTATPVATTV